MRNLWSHFQDTNCLSSCRTHTHKTPLPSRQDSHLTQLFRERTTHLWRTPNVSFLRKLSTTANNIEDSWKSGRDSHNNNNNNNNNNIIMTKHNGNNTSFRRLRHNGASVLLTIFLLTMTTLSREVSAFLRPVWPSTAKIIPVSSLVKRSLSQTSSDAFFSTESEDGASISSAMTVGLEKSLRHALQLDPTTVTASTSSSSSSHTLPLNRPLPWIVGHRGCLYRELENTRAGFMECAKMGCDAVELDVFCLKCGTVVVFHGDGTDENPGLLDNYCGVSGSILDYTYQEALEKLRFNPNYKEFGCPPEAIERGYIPKLEDVLVDAKQSGLCIKIELKGQGTVEPTLEIVERLDMMNQVGYSSFDHERLRQLRDLRPDPKLYPTGALFADNVGEDFLQRAKNCGATEVHLKYDTCTKSRVQEIHAAGFGSMIWMRGPIGMASDCTDKYWDVGNEDESMYLTILETGVQQVCINRPDVLLNWRNRMLQELQGDSSFFVADAVSAIFGQRNVTDATIAA